jgi:hypothetical protein
MRSVGGSLIRRRRRAGGVGPGFPARGSRPYGLQAWSDTPPRGKLEPSLKEYKDNPVTEAHARTSRYAHAMRSGNDGGS